MSDTTRYSRQILTRRTGALTFIYIRRAAATDSLLWHIIQIADIS